MTKDQIRKKGILLIINRVDRHFVKETWLYKLEKTDISVYDPSSYEIKTLLEASKKRSKFEKIMEDLCTLRRANKKLRRFGERRKTDKGLATMKAVDSYIEKKLRAKRRKKKKLKRKKS